MSVEEQSGQRMHEQVFRKRTSCTCASRAKESGSQVDEAQRDKLSEPARVHLNLPKQQQVPYPMLGELRVAVHHCGSRRNAELMCGADNLDPPLDLELVGTQRFAQFIVQDFSRRAWDAA